MNPGTHSEFCNEDIAPFCKQDWSLSGDHLDFRIGLHDLLDASQRQLMQLVVMFVRFELRDLLLPICV